MNETARIGADPRTWSNTTRRIVGDAVRVGANRMHRSAQRSLIAKGFAVQNERNETELLPEVSVAFHSWLSRPCDIKRKPLAD